jgi:translation initiation factor 4G
LSDSKDLPSRSRFMYKDLLDLRSNYWVPRRKEEKAKTIAEIRKDVEREEREQAQEAAAANQGGYRGNNNYGGRGGGGRGGGDYRNNNRSNYANNSNRPRPQRQAVQTDDDGFTTIIGGAKQVQPASAPSQKPQRILQSKPKQEAAKSSHPPLDQDKFDRRVKTIRNEYIQDPNNIKELLLSMDELTGTKDYGSKFVSLNADHMVDCKETERAAMYLLLEVCVKEGKISSNDVKTGLVDIIEFIDSYVCDAPLAFDYLGRMLATMIRCNAIDVTWVGKEAEKTKISSDANPEKIIHSLIKAIKADKGNEAVKTSFGPHQKAMETLLGAEKWDSIKKEIS